jgi:PTS system nitrogen regulatory IIA component
MQLNLEDTAGILNVPTSTVERWIKSDGLPAREVNGQYHLSSTELLEWATSHGIAMSVDRLIAEPAVATTARVSDALAVGGITYDLSGNDKRAVLQQVVAGLPLENDRARESLLELFLAREAVGSTAVGDGIAIPHPRLPLILPVRRPTLNLCFLAEPIDFGAKVPENVHTLFVLICPTIESHLQTLARVAQLLKEESFRAVLKRRAAPGEILGEVRRLERAA